ncbi:hypothetical protein K0M31_007495, partial [Melipona bicolor]
MAAGQGMFLWRRQRQENKQQTEQLLTEHRITTVNRWPFVITHPLEKLVNEAAEKQISLGESIKRVWLSQTA